METEYLDIKQKTRVVKRSFNRPLILKDRGLKITSVTKCSTKNIKGGYSYNRFPIRIHSYVGTRLNLLHVARRNSRKRYASTKGFSNL